MFIYTGQGESDSGATHPEGYKEISRTRLIEPTYPYAAQESGMAASRVRKPPRVRVQRQGTDLHLLGRRTLRPRRYRLIPAVWQSQTSNLEFRHNGGRIEGGYLVLLILAVLFDIGVFSGGHRSMKNRPESS